MIKKNMIKIWKQKCKNCKIYFINDLQINNDIYSKYCNDFVPTSGLICLTYLLNYTNNITLVGFDLPSNYTEKSNWFQNTPVWSGHNIPKEKELLKKLIDKYKLIII